MLQILQHFPKAPSIFIFGFCFILTWLFVPLLLGTDFGVYFHVSQGCTFFLIAILAQNHVIKKLEQSLWLSSIILALVPFLSIFPESFLSISIIIGGICAGIAHAWIASNWFDLFCRQPTKIAVNYTLICFVLSALIRLVFVVVPLFTGASLLIVLSCMPIFAQLCFTLVNKSYGSEGFLNRASSDGTINGAKPKNFYSAGFFLAIIFSGIILGIMQNGMPHWPESEASQHVGYALRALIPALLLLWFNIAQRSERYEVRLRIFIAVLAIGLTVPLFFNAYISSVTPVFVLVVRNFVSIMIYLMTYMLVRDYDVHPLVVFGVAKGVFNLADFFGLFLSIYTNLSKILSALDETVFYFFMSCVLIILFSCYSGVMSRVVRAISLRPMAKAVTADEQFQELSNRYSLTEREEEVLRLLLQGRTKRYIAETLYLSEDTIRWHTKNIYRKFGVHNKQELLTLSGAE